MKVVIKPSAELTRWQKARQKFLDLSDIAGRANTKEGSRELRIQALEALDAEKRAHYEHKRVVQGEKKE